MNYKYVIAGADNDFYDIAFKDVLCIWNREVVNCEEDAKS